MRQHLVRRNDFIERIGDLPFDAISTGPHPDREVPCPHRLQRLEQVVQDRPAIHAVPFIGSHSFVLPRALRFRLIECFASRLHRLAPTKYRIVSKGSLARHAPSVGGQPTLAGDKSACFVRV
jgi:hypothetical protein